MSGQKAKGEGEWGNMCRGVLQGGHMAWGSQVEDHVTVPWTDRQTGAQFKAFNVPWMIFN